MKTLCRRFPIAFFALFTLTTLISLTSCSDESVLICDVPTTQVELKIMVIGKMADFRLPDDELVERPVFVAKEWRGIDEDSVAKIRYKALEDALSYKESDLCILMPQDFTPPQGAGVEFLMTLQVKTCYTNKDHIVLSFLNYDDSSHDE